MAFAMTFFLFFRARNQTLLEEASKLELEVARLKASRRAGGLVSADFTSFPTPQMAKALKEGERTECVGRLRLARVDGVNKDESVVPLVVDFKELRAIHQTVMG